MEKSVLIYTDGACSGNPGPGGWGGIVVHEGQVTELGGFEEGTTNNRMEILATLKCLSLVQEVSGPVRLYTDSTYVIRGITQWIWGWQKKGWKTATGEPVLNQDLWQKLLQVTKQREGKIEWLYVRGHRGHAGNERCDEIAVAFSQRKPIQLYAGPEKNYSVDVWKLPTPEPLPEMHAAKEKKSAHSYLSVVEGLVMRHADWTACERRVKGQSNAKFKKAMSEQDERDILKSWGFDEAALSRKSKGGNE